MPDTTPLPSPPRRPAARAGRARVSLDSPNGGPAYYIFAVFVAAVLAVAAASGSLALARNHEMAMQVVAGLVVFGFSFGVMDMMNRRRAVTERLSKDLAERERIKNELAEQLFFTRQILNALPSPVYFKDTEQRFIGCNLAFEDWMGQSLEQISGKTVFDLYPPEIADQHAVRDR